MSVSNQITVFLYTIYGGVLIGLIYDLYKVFRIYRKPGKIATGIMDLFFWIIVALIAFNILFKSNYGELRGYAFLGFILGCLIYVKLCSKYIVNFLILVVKKMRKSAAIIYKVLIFPFDVLSKAIKGGGKWLYSRIPFLKKINLATNYIKGLFKQKNDK